MKLEVSFLCIYASECGQVHTSVCACLFVCFCKCVPWTQLCLFVSSAHFCICAVCTFRVLVWMCMRVCLLVGWQGVYRAFNIFKSILYQYLKHTYTVNTKYSRILLTLTNFRCRSEMSQIQSYSKFYLLCLMGAFSDCLSGKGSFLWWGQSLPLQLMFLSISSTILLSATHHQHYCR